MNFTKTQLNHINKQLNPDNHSISNEENDLQLDVSYHKLDDVNMAKIHIATQEEVVFSKWEDYLKSVEDKLSIEKNRKKLMLNIIKYLTAGLIIALAIVFYLVEKDLKDEVRILFYISFASLPLLLYFIITKIQDKIASSFYNELYTNLEKTNNTL